jgi:hypothetical protein
MLRPPALIHKREIANPASRYGAKRVGVTGMSVKKILKDPAYRVHAGTFAA